MSHILAYSEFPDLPSASRFCPLLGEIFGHLKEENIDINVEAVHVTMSHNLSLHLKHPPV